MIRSMTGFGRGAREEQGWRCAVEVRSVNGRHLDARLRLPSGLGHLEEALRRQVRDACERGKVDGTVSLTPVAEQAVAVGLNRPLLERYAQLLQEAEAALARPVHVSLGDLLAARDVLVAAGWEEQEDALLPLMQAALGDALGELVAMREREGASLAEELSGYCDALQGMLEASRPVVAEVPGLYAARLRESLQSLAGESGVSEERMAQEVAVFADRVDVSEELGRFATHLAHVRELLAAGGAVGRRLDFLMQELNREANTLGVKGNDARISAQVVDMKATIEKLREQVQNVE